MLNFFSGDYVLKSIWWAWLLVCLLTALVCLSVMGTYPMIQQDEVQILDFGRTFWEPLTDWSLDWNVQGGTPVLIFSFVGVGLQELAYQASSSLWGPRFLGLLAGLTAATSLLGLLLARGTNRLTAFAVSLIFLIDPIFSSVYTRGRIDGWAIAACLAACWLLCLARKRLEQKRDSKWLVFSAGALTSVSPFLWPTALMLFPLIILECYYFLKQILRSSERSALSDVTAQMAPFVFGGLLVALLVLWPMVTQWHAYWQSLLITAEIQGFAALRQKSVIDQFLVYDPLLILVLIASLFIRREPGLIIGLAVAYFMMVQTMVYLPRLLYLVPYFMLIIAGAGAAVSGMAHAHRRRLLMAALIMICLATNAVSTLGLRTYKALELQSATNPAQIYSAFKTVIGPGSHRVILEEWEGYYAARKLGWKIYHAGRPIPRQEYLEFAKTMDYVVIGTPAQSFLPQVSIEALSEEGFELISTITFEQPAKQTGDQGLLSVSLPTTGYPPLLVYKRPE